MVGGRIRIVACEEPDSATTPPPRAIGGGVMGGVAARLALRLLGRLAALGAAPLESHDVALSRQVLVASSLVCMVAGLVWFATYRAVGAPVAAAAPLAYALLSLASTTAFAFGRRYRIYLRTQLALILLLPWVMAVTLGGFHASSAVIIWSMLCPLGALLFEERRVAVAWFGGFLALVTASVALPLPAVEAPLPETFVLTFYGLNIAALSTIVFAMLAYFIHQKAVFQERSEFLLLSILPKQIADILKGSSRCIADHHEAASILFADIVGFSQLSRHLAPAELVAMLDAVFLRFDQLVEAAGLEKIKTIGDCYMVAAGVPNPREDHAQALARLALAMRGAVAEQRFMGRRVELRIGMNSGPVVAGVIGRKKFIYDLWGEAVNLASRMEAHGRSGSIQITRASYDLVKDDFFCEPGGIVSVKGMGETEVFHLLHERLPEHEVTTEEGPYWNQGAHI